MQSSIWLDYFENLTPEEAVANLRDAGFSCGELSVDHSRMLQARGVDVEKTGLAFRSYLENNGFALPQGHLDFQKDLTAPETVDIFKRELTLFQAVGVKHAMIHINGSEDLPEQQQKDIQLSRLRELLDFIKGSDISICIENLRPNPAVADATKILWWIEQLGGKNLGICLDTGHLHVANISKKTTTQTQAEFIHTAGNYLKATHINGNDGTDDYHLAPFAIKNSVDFRQVVTALRDIGYQGLFNLEIPGEIKGNPPLYVLQRKIRYLRELADFMISDAFQEANS